MYMAAARGTNDDFIFPLGYAGSAGNAFVAPDTQHLMFGGNATVKTDVDNADLFDLTLIDRAVTRASTMGGGTAKIPKLAPIRIDGEEHYVVCMHPFQRHNLRTATGEGKWLDIQKAAAGAEGRKSPIFMGNDGMHNNVILHTHNAIIGFSDYGSGANLPARRALFMGQQAAVLAFGSEGGQGNARFSWHEETEDRGNQVVITTSSIFGAKKTTFNIDGTVRTFGLINLDTYAADPG